MTPMDTLALIFIIVGALNWGLIGIFQFDAIAAIFGGMSNVVSRLLYTLVGLAGIWGISLLFRRDRRVRDHTGPTTGPGPGPDSDNDLR